MYSRNRMSSAEERYTGNIPPIYNGSRFSYARREQGGSRRYREKEDIVNPETETSAEHVSETVDTACPEGEMPMDEGAQTEGASEEVSEEVSEEAQSVHKEVTASPTGPLGGLFSGIGQEELLLIALLLLLSAEHERSMDIIVILLLLIGIH